MNEKTKVELSQVDLDRIDTALQTVRDGWEEMIRNPELKGVCRELETVSASWLELQNRISEASNNFE